MEAGRQHYNVTLAILTVAGTAYALQQTMVIPALPTLQRNLHTTTTWVTWVAFTIAAAAAFVGVVAAVLVTPRRERLVVAAETGD